MWGEDKVTMDFAFFAIAFNIKKDVYKTTKSRKREECTHYIYSLSDHV